MNGITITIYYEYEYVDEEYGITKIDYDYEKSDVE